MRIGTRVGHRGRSSKCKSTLENWLTFGQRWRRHWVSGKAATLLYVIRLESVCVQAGGATLALIYLLIVIQMAKVNKGLEV